MKRELRIVEFVRSGFFARWMWNRGWRGFVLPIPLIGVMFIFYWVAQKGNKPTPRSRAHERDGHGGQVQRLGAFKWWCIWWSQTLTVGYWDNVLEIEARVVEKANAHFYEDLTEG